MADDKAASSKAADSRRIKAAYLELDPKRDGFFSNDVLSVFLKKAGCSLNAADLLPVLDPQRLGICCWPDIRRYFQLPSTDNDVRSL